MLFQISQFRPLNFVIYLIRSIREITLMIYFHLETRPSRTIYHHRWQINTKFRQTLTKKKNNTRNFLYEEFGKKKNSSEATNYYDPGINIIVALHRMKNIILLWKIPVDDIVSLKVQVQSTYYFGVKKLENWAGKKLASVWCWFPLPLLTLYSLNPQIFRLDYTPTVWVFDKTDFEEGTRYVGSR